MSGLPSVSRPPTLLASIDISGLPENNNLFEQNHYHKKCFNQFILPKLNQLISLLNKVTQTLLLFLQISENSNKKKVLLENRFNLKKKSQQIPASSVV